MNSLNRILSSESQLRQRHLSTGSTGSSAGSTIGSVGSADESNPDVLSLEENDEIEEEFGKRRQFRETQNSLFNRSLKVDDFNAEPKDVVKTPRKKSFAESTFQVGGRRKISRNDEEDIEEHFTPKPIESLVEPKTVKKSPLDLRALKKSLAETENMLQKRNSEMQLKLENEGENSPKIKTSEKNGDGSKATIGFVPPKHLLQYLVRMGSLGSMPRVIPSPGADDSDLTYPEGPVTLDQVLRKCSKELTGLPKAIERSWSKIRPSSNNNKTESSTTTGNGSFRVLQWNVLSQALGTENDNFVKCPRAALNWRIRRFRMLEEIVRHSPDLICLQEVDHFPFLQKSLKGLGYSGMFFPKPDSPCLYLNNNSGPDGCAIFYRTENFDLVKVQQRIVQVWHVESNQVVLCAILREKTTGEEICLATTHLKARNGALLSTLRNEQGRDILEFLEQTSKTEDFQTETKLRPVLICGDFNAEPTEPVYATMTNPESALRLKSAYASNRSEAEYTTWKIREDGEHKQTLDYIFHSGSDLEVESVLEFPSESEIGDSRLPSFSYASDHLSLVADFRVIKQEHQ